VKLGVDSKTTKDEKDENNDSDKQEVIDLQLIPASHEEAPKHAFKKKFVFAFTFYAVTVSPRTWPLRPFFGHRNWWDEVIPGLILGAIPITEYGHKQALSQYFARKKRPLKRIVSCCTHPELKGEGLGVTPIPPRYWARQGIKQDHLNMADFTGMINTESTSLLTEAALELKCLEQIHQSILNINEDLEAGSSAYVHCKAGRGRSVLVVVCYLIYFLDKTPQEAIDFTRSKRPEISLSAAQIDFIFKYCNQYRPNLLNISGEDSLALIPYQEERTQKTSWFDTIMQYLFNLVSDRLTSDYRVLQMYLAQANDANMQVLMDKLSTPQARALHAGLTNEPLDTQTLVTYYPIHHAGRQAREQQLENADTMVDALAVTLGALELNDSNPSKPKTNVQ
tara:strand:+ start:4295 stop:5476 length:1182 start_codon:yes stop_codon:yes gene_type:complete